MLKLTPADYRTMPWKNGGGETTELFAEPDQDGSGFLWRVSIATIAAAGPFSLFEGCDRHIMTIEGSGIVLRGGPDGPIAVSPKFHPRWFSGDWPIASNLIDGPVRDFNLIARRNRIESSLECLEIAGPLDIGSAGTTSFLYLLEGTLAATALPGRTQLSEGESLLLQPGQQAVIASVQERPSRIALAHLF